MNEALGMTWKEARAELFTPEEIRASKERIAPIIAKINGYHTPQPDYFSQKVNVMELLPV